LKTLKSSLFFRISLITVLIPLFFGCDNTVRKSGNAMNADGSIPSEIVVPAGDVVEGYDQLNLPAFFNLGKIELEKSVIQTIILAPRQKQGAELKVFPIAEFRFVKDTINERFLLTMPVNEHQPKANFETFVTEHSDLISSIESWYRGQCGISQCRSFSWSNPDKLLMNKF